MIRAVFATNVFISALFNPERPPAQILELALQGKIKLTISPQLLGEIERVLTSPKIKKLLKKRQMAPGEIGADIAKILKITVITPGNLIMGAVPDDPRRLHGFALRPGGPGRLYCLGRPPPFRPRHLSGDQDRVFCGIFANNGERTLKSLLIPSRDLCETTFLSS
jgi:putative PIN family toxin of toxin-antitoxin system